jgi:hypothetical protein
MAADRQTSIDQQDREYMAQYPYLARHLDELPVEGRDVLGLDLYVRARK